VSVDPAPADAVLWARVRAGDEQAFEQIFDRYSGRIYTFCFRSVGSWDQAQDLVSVVFLHAWRRRAHAEIVHDSIGAWLLGVAEHCCRNHRRSLWRSSRLVGRVHEQLAEVQHDFADEVALKVDTEAQMARVLAEVSRLRRHEQEIIRLCLFGELSVEDAASTLGIAVGTAKSRLSRARGRLKTALEAVEPPDRASPAADQSGRPSPSAPSPSTLTRAFRPKPLEEP